MFSVIHITADIRIKKENKKKNANHKDVMLLPMRRHFILYRRFFFTRMHTHGARAHHNIAACTRRIHPSFIPFRHTCALGARRTTNKHHRREIMFIHIRRVFSLSLSLAVSLIYLYIYSMYIYCVMAICMHHNRECVCVCDTHQQPKRNSSTHNFNRCTNLLFYPHFICRAVYLSTNGAIYLHTHRT